MELFLTITQMWDHYKRFFPNVEMHAIGKCIARKPTCFELHSKTTANTSQTDSILLTNSKKTTNIEQNNIQMAGNVWVEYYIWYILIRLIARWAQPQTVELAISPTQCSIANMSNICAFLRDRRDTCGI